MKRFRNSYIIAALLLVSIFLLPFCTKNDQVIDTTPEVPINSSTDLVSLKVTTPPAIDGTIDAMWESHPKLEFSTAVPEVTGDVFRGYTGNIIPSVTMRSAYDATNIYFLVEWVDPTESLKRNPWYFNPTTKKWAQESGTFTFNTNGSIARLPFYEDKLSMLWNINNSVSGWNSATCYKSCHTGLPASDGSSKHFTNFSTEKIDMWHWKSVRGGVNAGFQVHDQVQNNTYPNGRTSDGGSDVYANNSQTLTSTGPLALSLTVPKFVVPTKTNYGWIYNNDPDIKTVTAVSDDGLLTLNDGTIIDPYIGTDYQRVGDPKTGGVGPKAIPGLTLNPAGYGQSQGDISCKSSYTAGKGWTLEISRLLKTTDAVADVDFSSLADQYFGFAIFENAQIAHSIKPNLVLKFQK